MPPPLPPRYLISRTADPIFALLTGLGAAVVRIRREEVLEKGRDGRDVVRDGVRRAGLAGWVDV